MIHKKLISIFLLFRNGFMKYIFGKITMIHFNDKCLPINFFLPYIFFIFLEFIKLKYVYKYDNIYHYQDYTNIEILLPPILSFKIAGNDKITILKNYKSNIPVIYFLYNNNLCNTKLCELTYWYKGSIKEKTIKNIEVYNCLYDIFD
tara:strand:+ start:22 stop:462 length:441 start_codon:yes stop_codon:yes gene_type:complete